MDKNTVAILALGILALLLIAFFAVFRGKGRFKLKGPLGMDASAEGENPGSVAPGVKIGEIETEAKVTLRSSGTGGVSAEKIRATGDVSVSHTPKTSRPKK